MTKDTFFKLLKSWGLHPKSRRLQDYEIAKRRISWDNPSSEEYERKIQWLMEYLGV